MKMIHRKLLLPLAFSLAALSGCGTASKHAGIQHEEFGATGVFTRSFPGTEKGACEAARRALLSQGYVISDWKPSVLKGRRKYQPEADVHAEIEFNVVCVADSKGSNSTTMFANAIRDRYSLKKSNTSASIGVSAIGSVSLPFGSTDDALVKVASETIPTGQFYEQFFELVERYLDSVPYIQEPETDKKTAAAPTPPAPSGSPATASAAGASNATESTREEEED
ncbi:DUF2242 domain-containing protein [Undibacterium sp. TS12]|uniref:DUF2242 domain-containing protein n=1 Tax=Undibacterium sp. TS12 TaxID=2908202 RepID=UPI001F4C814F|nr:DUF2242 domain-containing protein [Undibacterium sp. TS12]MCH8622447.1 DUF2242 domain-containing protein [Undibacterium sp. TS12]